MNDGPRVIAIFPDNEEIDRAINPVSTSGLSDEEARQMFAELKLFYAESKRIAKVIKEMADTILEPLNVRILAIEGRLKTHALIMQESITTPDGAAVYTSDYVRTSYSKADVEKFADGHPDIASELRAIAKETWVEASVSIRMK